ncbi:alpha-tocopherol transfer protein-like isoform X1 [Periplaneta americana]|uniref:alpha-tocopherol transfer protein-like isoform X1 n=1 Tax=Periplaneta americana TaxID=6978 RepID=UPI0037E9A294
MTKELVFPNREVKEKIWAEYGLDERSIKEAVEMLKDWLQLQPHLPKEEGSLHEARLERWLIRCKNSMERTKQSIDMYYTLKSLLPEMMSDWNIESKWFKTISKLAYYTPMPQMTPDYERVVCFGLLSNDPTDLVTEDWYRMALMTFEVRMCEDYSLRDIFIIDLAHYTLAHVIKFTLPSMKKTETCIVKAFSTRLKAVHFINVQPFAAVIVDLLKHVLPSKIATRVYAHGTDLTEFHKQVPKESLPTEMGGCGGSIIDNWNLWLKKLETYQDWFLQHENVKSDEKKRLEGNSISSDLFGFEGSFRKLDVD